MNKLAIFGVPRSGTSWLSQIFNSHPDVILRFQPLFSYEHKGKLSESSSANEINEFFEEIFSSSDQFALMSSETHKSYPKFKKSEEPTHIAFKETRYLNIIENLIINCPAVKIIGIVRNPLATLSSWLRAPKEFDKNWDVNQEWRDAPSKNQGKPEEYYGYSKWKEVASNFKRYEKIFPDQFKLVRYDSLNANTNVVTNELFKFCGLSMCLQVEEFIKLSHSKDDSDPYSIFRVKANDNQWRKYLPRNIVDEVRRDLENTQLNTFLVNHSA